jgi:hypothetical protein
LLSSCNILRCNCLIRNSMEGHKITFIHLPSWNIVFSHLNIPLVHCWVAIRSLYYELPRKPALVV